MKSLQITFAICLATLVAFSSGFAIDSVDNSGVVSEITSNNELDNKLKQAGNKLVVIDFFATWCGPCKEMEPVFKALAKENSDVVFLKSDVDKADDLAEKYEIEIVPTFIFIKNNKKVDKLVGGSQNKLKELIKKHKTA